MKPFKYFFKESNFNGHLNKIPPKAVKTIKDCEADGWILNMIIQNKYIYSKPTDLQNLDKPWEVIVINVDTGNTKHLGEHDPNANNELFKLRQAKEALKQQKLKNEFGNDIGQTIYDL